MFLVLIAPELSAIVILCQRLISTCFHAYTAILWKKEDVGWYLFQNRAWLPARANFLFTFTSRLQTLAFLIILNNLLRFLVHKAYIKHLKLRNVLPFGFSNRSQFIIRQMFG